MNATSIYDAITAQIMTALESGSVPWSKPWTTYGPPRNATTGRPYRGVNVWLLALEPTHDDPRWLTFPQALKLGGHVRKGERSRFVVFWDASTAAQSEEEGDDSEEQGSPRRHAPRLKVYRVFNAEQCDGLALAPLAAVRPDVAPLDAAEAIVAAMPQRPPITDDGGDRAFYRPATDSIHMPARSRFTDSGEYYSTLFHELGHSTGHPSRLDRHEAETGIAPFGSPIYSKEELAAEFCAAFLCAASGITHTIPNSAAYVAGWLKALKDDRRMIVTAASQGQRAAEFIMGQPTPAAAMEAQAAAA